MFWGDFVKMSLFRQSVLPIKFVLTGVRKKKIGKNDTNADGFISRAELEKA